MLKIMKKIKKMFIILNKINDDDAYNDEQNKKK